MTNSNLVLKNMISRMWKYNKNNFIVDLKVDIQNCQPILNPTYNSLTMKENLFVFLNKDYDILGFLEGNCQVNLFNKQYAKDTDFPKNRKHLMLNSEYVLMFTPLMRTFKVTDKKNKYKCNNYDLKLQAKVALRERLQVYKNNKYNELNHDDIIKISETVLIKLSRNITNNNLLEKLKPVISSFDNNILSAIQTFSREVENYMNNYDSVKNELKYCNEIEKTLSYKDLIKSRNTIIRWNQILK